MDMEVTAWKEGDQGTNGGLRRSGACPLGEERGPSPMWRATPELHAAVRELADRRGETVSTVVRQAVRAYLETTSAR